MTEKIITVFGATGQQGGSVVRALAAAGSGFKVRAVTRNSKGEKAKALEELGIDVVEASLDDPETLKSAVAGSYGVFLVTNYWEYMDKAREIKQGKDAADASKEAGVQHFIYSGLELVKDITGRECPHFDGKGEVEKYLDEIKLPNTSVRLPAFFQVFMLPPFYIKQDDGSFTYTTCMDGPMDCIDVSGMGQVVAAFFSHPEEYIGKKIGLSSDRITMEQALETVASVAGVKVNLNKVPYEVFGKFPFPGADDTAAMFHFYANGNPVRDRELTKRLNPDVKTFKEWAENNKDAFSFFHDV